jgi:mannose-6-phosphate isomerase-like protein (cupin superfamily)
MEVSVRTYREVVKMKDNPKIEPKIVRMADWKTVVYPHATLAYLNRVEGVGNTGLWIMKPGTETRVFSLEDEDDGTTGAWFRACHEFYYVLVGEFTVWWGTDATKIKSKKTDKFVVKEGEYLHLARGWKYMTTNTGKVPGTLFWGMTSPPKGTKIRRNFEHVET